MQLILLSIHLLVCLCLIGLVLLQRSEGGALGMGGGGGALMSGRGAADALARMTQFAGGFFLVTSLGLTVLSGAAQSSDGRSVFDLIPHQTQTAPASTNPAPTTPARPDPTESSAPQTTNSELASLAQPPAAEAAILPPATIVAPPPSQASQRAAALNGATQAGPIQASANNQQRVAANTAPTTVRQPPATTQRSGATTTQTATQPARQQPRPATTALILPNSAGVVEDPNAAPISTESGQSGSGVEAVRRERAGPDQ